MVRQKANQQQFFLAVIKRLRLKKKNEVRYPKFGCELYYFNPILDLEVRSLFD